MTEWNDETLSFSRCRRRRVWANFLGVSISSNGAMLLLREMERRLGLVKRVARSLGDARQRGKVRHDVVTMLRQRVLALALGYEDLNDHDTLRDGLVVQTACEGARRLASSSTLCGFERRAERQWAIAIHHPRRHVRTDCRVKPGRDRLLARAPALRTRRLAPTVVAHRAFRNPQQPSDVAVRTLSACRAAERTGRSRRLNGQGSGRTGVRQAPSVPGAPSAWSSVPCVRSQGRRVRGSAPLALMAKLPRVDMVASRNWF